MSGKTLEDYSEATAIRRGVRLVEESDGLNFSFLNAIVYIVLILLVITAVLSVFGAA